MVNKSAKRCKKMKNSKPVMEQAETANPSYVKNMDNRKIELEQAIGEFKKMFGNSEPQPHLFIAFQSMVKELKQIENFGTDVPNV